MVEANQDQAQALSNAYTDLRQATTDDDHAKVLASADIILAIDDSERTHGARKAKLTSLIKKRDFVEALKFLNKNEYTKKNCMVEACYILHRQDQNKQALA